jgi:Predicted transcription factor, homolog of eukaryotic MBF1
MSNIYSDDYVEIITRLRSTRIKKGITQETLASRLNTSQSIVSKVENCERKLDIIEFFEWSKALEVPWRTLLPPQYLKDQE